MFFRRGIPHYTLANTGKQPEKSGNLYYTILHIFTIDPASFGLNGHHQGTQQSYQEPSRSLYAKL
jgi:hypothetical protein